MMKLIAVILAVSVLTNAEFVVKKPADLVEARKVCFEEVHLPEKYVEEVKKYVYSNDPIVHKYMLCSSKKLGFFDETTGYNVDYLVQQFSFDQDKTHVQTLIEKCIDHNEQKTTVEEWAWRNYKCLVDSGILTPTNKQAVHS